MKKGFGEFIVDNWVWIILAIGLVSFMLYIVITSQGIDIEYPI